MCYLKTKSLSIWLALILIISLVPIELQSQPLPPPDGDEDILPAGMGDGVGRGKGHRARGLDLANFSWESAEKTVLPLIKKDNVALYQFIISNKDKNTAVSKRITRGVAVLTGVKENHPEQFQEIFRIHSEELEIERLATLYQQESNENKKSDLKNQIKAKLTSVFDQKEKVRLIIISRLEENLNKQKKEYQKRQDKKGKIVDKRLKRLLEDNDEMDW